MIFHFKFPVWLHKIQNFNFNLRKNVSKIPLSFFICSFVDAPINFDVISQIGLERARMLL